MMTNSFYGLTNEESNGLYGSSINYGGTYFQWYVYQVSATQPATPTGGSWNFQTNTGTAPTGWLATPPVNPLSNVWVSIAVVSSLNTSSLTWSIPGEFAFSTGSAFGTMALQNANAVAITGGTLNGATIGGGSF